MWLHSLVGRLRASHQYRGGHGFESRLSLDFFQASTFKLLKLKNLLRWSFFTLDTSMLVNLVSYYITLHCKLLKFSIQYSRKHSAPRLACLPAAIAADHASLACIASVSVGFGSKERSRNGTRTVFCPREIGARAKIRKEGNSLPLNPTTETLASQANASQGLNCTGTEGDATLLQINLWLNRHSLERLTYANKIKRARELIHKRSVVPFHTSQILQSYQPACLPQSRILFVQLCASE